MCSRQPVLHTGDNNRLGKISFWGWRFILLFRRFSLPFRIFSQQQLSTIQRVEDTLRLHHPPDIRSKMKNVEHLTTAYSDVGQSQGYNPLPWDNILQDLQWCSEEQNLFVRQFLQMTSPGLNLYTDVSVKGWGVSFLQESKRRIWINTKDSCISVS